MVQEDRGVDAGLMKHQFFPVTRRRPLTSCSWPDSDCTVKSVLGQLLPSSGQQCRLACRPFIGRSKRAGVLWLRAPTKDPHWMLRLDQRRTRSTRPVSKIRGALGALLPVQS
eukprot:TRINITY_DN75660_c0_g1_i1.p1 TRINITY_DN75660_c0_g1~~TRINITY_DN75660_c0_g1_i1.p1  ORF type:complete len:112 (+),score=12.25 TRINITY_DN75660_c0_g1_i1:3-338(+)